jgi:hypothetical protein
METRQQLKEWFSRGMRPTGKQFAAWIDSFWHKGDKIAISDVEGLQSELSGKAPTTHGHTRSQIADFAHTHPASDVGLGNVDNTRDVNKPVSTPQRAALNLKEDVSNKGIAGGYASLDDGGKIPLSQLSDVILGQTLYAGAVYQEGDRMAGYTTYAHLSQNARRKIDEVATVGGGLIGEGLIDEGLIGEGAILPPKGGEPVRPQEPKPEPEPHLLNPDSYGDYEGMYFIWQGDGLFAEQQFVAGDWLVATADGWARIGAGGGGEANEEIGTFDPILVWDNFLDTYNYPNDAVAWINGLMELPTFHYHKIGKQVRVWSELKFDGGMSAFDFLNSQEYTLSMFGGGFFQLPFPMQDHESGNVTIKQGGEKFVNTGWNQPAIVIHEATYTSI